MSLALACRMCSGYSRSAFFFGGLSDSCRVCGRSHRRTLGDEPWVRSVGWRALGVKPSDRADWINRCDIAHPNGGNVCALRCGFCINCKTSPRAGGAIGNFGDHAIWRRGINHLLATDFDAFKSLWVVSDMANPCCQRITYLRARALVQPKNGKWDLRTP